MLFKLLTLVSIYRLNKVGLLKEYIELIDLHERQVLEKLGKKLKA